jgi:hypothetical protein
MPLPEGKNLPWPPIDATVRDAMADWDAWYSADPDRLAERYRNRGDKSVQNRPSQYRGGITGRFARWWWGQPTPIGEKRVKLHVPLAGDIARTSSNLLFSEPPSITVAHGATQDRIVEMIEGGLHTKLIELGEVCAALGGAYLRVVWDLEMSDRPWIDVVHADGAAPEWRYGRLWAVTFWRVLAVDGQQVTRHLERHERGYILHGLYEGTEGILGKPLPLDARAETKGLKPVVETGALKHLTAAYLPNIRPARAWRNIPGAANLGRSDYQGIEGILDALDETYSSWMRDVRLGAGRVIVPESMLAGNGPGQGASFDDREIYSGLNVLQRADSSSQLTLVQFKIRIEEHRGTCLELTQQAVRQAGYSAGTFGSDSEGAAVTATEIRARNARSMSTRAHKALYGKIAIAEIIEAQLAVEAGLLFKGDVEVECPDVEFQDSISEDPKTLAETAELLRRAQAASTETIVRLINPDWDDDRIDDEVARIQAETGMSTQDPTTFGADEPPDDPADEEPDLIEG